MTPEEKVKQFRYFLNVLDEIEEEDRKKREQEEKEKRDKLLFFKTIKCFKHFFKTSYNYFFFFNSDRGHKRSGG